MSVFGKFARALASPQSGWHLIAGPTLWGGWFVAAYGGLSVACAQAAPGPQQGPWTWINLVLWLVSLATLAVLGWATVYCWRGARAQRQAPVSTPAHFTPSLAAGLYLMSTLATLFISIPVLLLDPCR